MPSFVPDKPLAGGGGGGTFVPDSPRGRGGKKKKGGGGVFGTLSRIPGAAAHDLLSMALHSPAGAYEVGRAVVGPAYADIRHGPGSVQAQRERKRQTDLAIGLATAPVQDVKHPLRHPGNLGLDLLALASLGVGAGARVGTASRVASEGGRAADVARALATRPQPVPRTLRLEGAQAELVTSRNALRAATQRARDRRLMAQAAKGGPESRAYQNLAHKISTQYERETAVGQKVGLAQHKVLSAIDKRLSNVQKMAIRIVAEQKPVEEALSFHEQRILDLSRHQVTPEVRQEIRRHESTIKLIEGAGERYVHTVNGRPAFKPGVKTKVGHLEDVYARAKKAEASTEGLLRELGFDEEGLVARKAAPGRVIGGARYEKPTPGKLGKSPALERAVKRRDSLKRRYDRYTKKGLRRGYELTERPRSELEAHARLGELEAKHDKFMEQVSGQMFQPKLTKEDRAEQARRNVLNGKYKKQASGKSGASGRKVPRLLPTVKEEQRAAAEARVDAALEKMGEHPSAVRMRAEREEITRLRDALQPLPGEAIAAERLGTVPHSVYRSQSPTQTRIGGALSVAEDDVQRLSAMAERRVKPTGLVGDEAFTAEEGLYLPGSRAPGKTGRIGVPGRGAVGIPQSPAALRTTYRGESKLHALERPDVLRALGEHGAQIASYVGKLRALEALRPLGRTAPPTSGGWRFIRTDPGKLGPSTRDVINKVVRDEEELTPKQAESLGERIKELGRNALNAGEKLTEDEQLVLANEGKGLWVPAKALKPFENSFAARRTGKGAGFVDEVNNAFKIQTLYLKPAYAIPNLLGNIALSFVQQGFAAPANLKRALFLSRHVDQETLLAMDELMGEGVSGALRGEGARPAGRAARFAAGKWSAVVDRVPRRAAFLYEARKAGYTNARQLRRLVSDESLQGDLAHITERANREMIDYEGLSPFEQEYVRRAIYFYPWVRGATVYGGRLIAEHPVAAAALGELGREGSRYAESTIGPVPYYLEGAFGAGRNRLVNPAAAAILATPAQVAETIYSTATGHPNLPTASELSSPLGEALLTGITGQNSLGIPVTGRGGPLIQSLIEQERGTAIPVALQRIVEARAKGGKPIAPRWVEKALGAEPSKQRMFPPDVRTALMLYVLGGALTPRRYDPVKLREAYEREVAGRR